MFKAKCDTIYIINIWIYEGFNATTHLFLMMQILPTPPRRADVIFNLLCIS